MAERVGPAARGLRARGAAGRELGGRDPGPGLRPCGRRFAAGLKPARAAAGPLRAPLASGGVQGRGLPCPASEASPPPGAPHRDRLGAAVPQFPPGASQGSVLFLFVALAEVAGRKLKELSPHFS